MVLLLINIDLKDDYLGGNMIGLNEILNSIAAQEGYCGHSVNWDLKRHERLLLITEWKSEAAVERYLQTDEFKLLLETAKTVGKNYAMSLANVLSRGGFELTKEQVVSPLEGGQGLQRV
jgi:quinol monooxygenase YgiN